MTSSASKWSRLSRLSPALPTCLHLVPSCLCSLLSEANLRYGLNHSLQPPSPHLLLNGFGIKRGCKESRESLGYWVLWLAPCWPWVGLASFLTEGGHFWPFLLWLQLLIDSHSLSLFSQAWAARLSFTLLLVLGHLTILVGLPNFTQSL